MPSLSPSNSYLGKTKDPGFIVEHDIYMAWSPPLVNLGWLSQLCPRPASCPASAYSPVDTQTEGEEALVLCKRCSAPA